MRDFTVPSPGRDATVVRRRYQRGMSYTLSLQCGCTVYVSCHPVTGIAHTRVIERRGSACAVRRHEVGLRLFLWEILPEREGLRGSAPGVPLPSR